jgi:putative redox protein
MTAIASITANLGSVPYTVRLTDDLGHHWLSDEPPDKQGANLGPTPTRLLVASLGACTAITMKMYAERKGWPLERVDVRVELLTYVPVPEGGTSIRCGIVLVGPLSPEQRERLMAIAGACPVHRILNAPIRIEARLEEERTEETRKSGGAESGPVGGNA